jgi:hypothetical protein
MKVAIILIEVIQAPKGMETLHHAVYHHSSIAWEMEGNISVCNVRLVPVRAAARARRGRCRPRAGDIASLSPALERPPGREAGEREARGRRGTGGARARARATWRDLIGPRVAI